MNQHFAFGHRFRAAALAAGSGASLALAASLGAQSVVGCDFDIADDQGVMVWGNTVHLTGEAGRSSRVGQSNTGRFVIINANTADFDVDHDGFALACDYNDLFIPQALRTPLINDANPALAIPSENIVVFNLPRQLVSGSAAQVGVYVEIPPGTVAGTYVGEFQVRDSVRGVSFGPNNETLGADLLVVELTVLPDRGIALVHPDTAGPLDSLVIRGRAGQTASGVLRLANAGNAPLSDLRLSATDLRSESAVGLVIPASNISFSTASFSGLGVTDTARVTVSVRIPRGILGGRYRGTLVAQAENAERAEIPLIVIVTSGRGILIADNPVRGGTNSVAQIAFNGDPGTNYRLGIYDMLGLLVWSDDGTVFPGLGGTQETPTPGADFAVNYIWPLRNGRGENVSSGMYLVVVESIVNGQRQLAQDKLMVIR